MDANWQQIGSNADGDLMVRKLERYKMAWKGIDLMEMMAAVAPNGGPIALSNDPNKAIVDTTGRRPDIKVYTSSGVLLTSWLLRQDSVLCGMGWTHEEVLLVVYKNGVAELYSLEHGQIAVENCRTEEILQTSFYSMGAFVLTKRLQLKHIFVDKERGNRALELQELKHLKLTEEPLAIHAYAAPDEGSPDRDPRSCWAACLLSPAEHDNPSASLYRVWVRDGEPGCDDLRDTYGRKVSAVRQMCLSPCTRYMAALWDGRVDWVSEHPEEKLLAKFNSRSNEPPAQLLWCGSDAIVAIWHPYQLEDSQAKKPELKGKSLLVLISRGEFEQFRFEGTITAVQEIDCVRVLTNTHCLIIERVPSSVVEIFDTASTATSSLLFDAYEDFEKAATNSIQQIRKKDADELSKAVGRLTEAAGHEWDPEVQKKLLNAASYGKCFCKKYDAQAFTDQCKKLRVLNAVRDKDVGIPLSSAQYDFVSPTVLVNRLVQRRLYFLAFRICTYLDLDAKDTVLVRWAQDKIRAMHSGSETLTDDELVAAIKEKFGDTPGLYRKAAEYAMNLEKKPLAIKLLHNEAKASDQVDLLMKMKEYARALERATSSSDSDLVYLVLARIRKEAASEKLIRIVSENREAQGFFAAYYEQHDDKLFQDYLKERHEHHRSAIRALQRFVNGPSDVDSAKRCLEESHRAFHQGKAKTEEQLVKQQQELFTRQLEFARNYREEEFRKQGLPVVGVLRLLIKSGAPASEVDKLCKEFDIPDEMQVWARAKAYCEFGKLKELEEYANSHAKQIKKHTAFHPLVTACMDRGLKTEALKYVRRIPEDQYHKQCEALCKLGEIEEAINVAKKHRDEEVLETIRTTTTNPTHHRLVDEALKMI